MTHVAYMEGGKLMRAGPIDAISDLVQVRGHMFSLAAAGARGRWVMCLVPGLEPGVTVVECCFGRRG